MEEITFKELRVFMQRTQKNVRTDMFTVYTVVFTGTAFTCKQTVGQTSEVQSSDEMSDFTRNKSVTLNCHVSSLT